MPPAAVGMPPALRRMPPPTPPHPPPPVSAKSALLGYKWGHDGPNAKKYVLLRFPLVHPNRRPLRPPTVRRLTPTRSPVRPGRPPRVSAPFVRPARPPNCLPAHRVPQNPQGGKMNSVFNRQAVCPAPFICYALCNQQARCRQTGHWLQLLGDTEKQNCHMANTRDFVRW